MRGKLLVNCMRTYLRYHKNYIQTQNSLTRLCLFIFFFLGIRSRILLLYTFISFRSNHQKLMPKLPFILYVSTYIILLLLLLFTHKLLYIKIFSGGGEDLNSLLLVFEFLDGFFFLCLLFER